MMGLLRKLVRVGETVGVTVTLGHYLSWSEDCERGWMGTAELLHERRSWPSQVRLLLFLSRNLGSYSH